MADSSRGRLCREANLHKRLQKMPSDQTIESLVLHVLIMKSCGRTKIGVGLAILWILGKDIRENGSAGHRPLKGSNM